jgi:hypothetical protein
MANIFNYPTTTNVLRTDTFDEWKNKTNDIKSHTLYVQSLIGDFNSLTTESKTVVGAFNEIVGDITGIGNDIGDTSAISSGNIANYNEERNFSESDDLVGAINDLNDYLYDKIVKDVSTEKSAREQGDIDLQDKIDIIEGSVGLSTVGIYQQNSNSNYLKNATSMHDADDRLDRTLKSTNDILDNTRDFLGTGTDGTGDLFDIEGDDDVTVIDALDFLNDRRISMSKIQEGHGKNLASNNGKIRDLEANFDSTSLPKTLKSLGVKSIGDEFDLENDNYNYLKSKENLPKNMRRIDDAIKQAYETAATSSGSAGIALGLIDQIIESVGLNSDGTYTSNIDSNATTMKLADGLLDEKISSLSDDIDDISDRIDNITGSDGFGGDITALTDRVKDNEDSISTNTTSIDNILTFVNSIGTSGVAYKAPSGAYLKNTQTLSQALSALDGAIGNVSGAATYDWYDNQTNTPYKLRVLGQADYNNIAKKDSQTIYFITDGIQTL